MNFKEIDDEIKHYYDSDEDDILNDFYIKLLKRAKFYRRMTGAFSSTILAGAAKGLSHFIKNDGKMELICWASLSEKDVEAINKGLEKPDTIIENYVGNTLTLENVENKFIEDHLKALGWMISNDYLEIKIAVKTAIKYKLDSKILEDYLNIDSSLPIITKERDKLQIARNQGFDILTFN